MPIYALIIANYFSLLQKKWHIIYLQLQVQARARKFYAADCSLVLRSRCIARRLICTHTTKLYAHRPARYAPSPARSTRPRCTSPPLRESASWLAAPGLCRAVRRHAAASPPGRGLLRPSTRGTDGQRREARKARRREAAAEEATTAASGATNANRWNAEQDFL